MPNSLHRPPFLREVKTPTDLHWEVRDLRAAKGFIFGFLAGLSIWLLGSLVAGVIAYG